MPEAPFDLHGAQRWFAVELNNLAWDLLAKPNRSREETERMLHAAHASVYHWLAAGNELNQLRGGILLANVYAAAGAAERALHYAEEVLKLSDQAGDQQSPFDRATALACAARANEAAGKQAEAARFGQLARQAADKLDAEERPVFDELCPQTT